MGLGTDSSVSTVLHPRLHTSQTFHRHLVTMQSATETKRPNHEIRQTWADEPLLTALPCVFANVAGDGPQAVQERDGTEYVTVTEDYRLKLTDLYPAIEVGMRAVVRFSHPPHDLTGIYDIIGVDHGSQGDVTRLRLEKVSA